MHRLFVALRPPPVLRARLLGIMTGVAGARWQNDEQLHVTLRFIGEVERPVADDVATALEGVRCPPASLALNGVGAFVHKGSPRSLWAGVAPDPSLLTLHRRVHRALVMAGISPQPQAFLPHITLARLGRSSGPVEPFLQRNAGLAEAPAGCAAFILFESCLGSDGASYSAVARYPLG